MIDWTAEADALLIKLWGEGLSLSDIADGLKVAGYDVSRNAVSGRRHRITRSALKTQTPMPVRRPRPRIVTPPKKKKPTAVNAASEVRGVDYFENDGCKALLDRRGDSGLPLACGEPLAFEGSVYCCTHAERFHHPQQGIRRSPHGKASQVPGNRNLRQGRA